MTLHIRGAAETDLSRCAAIESICFPPEQAASPEAIRRRLAAYGDHILLGELDGEVVGYIMGPVIAAPYIADEMYADEGCHDPAGTHQAVFSLCVLPPFRRKGLGGQLLHAMVALARQQGRQTVTLTCREEKIPFYRSFGFRDHGVADSDHGGVVWHNMVYAVE